MHLRHGHVLGRFAGATNVDGLLGAVTRPIRAREHDCAAGIGDEADVQHGERVSDHLGLEHLVDRQRIVVHGFRVQGCPLTRRHRHLRPLFERRAVLVHVPRGDEAEPGRRGTEAIGDFVTTGDAGVAHTRHAHLRAAAFAMGNHRDIAQVMMQRRYRVLHHDDKGAAADAGAVNVARRDAQRFGDQCR